MQEHSARDFAIESHGGQRYGDQPYSVHLAAVCGIVRALVGGERVLEEVAWLHDVLEDTSITASELRRRFGDVVTAAVVLVSDPPGPDRRTRKQALHRQLAAVDGREPAGRAALIVKAADRLANARASSASSPQLLAMYRAEHPEFRRAVYRAGLCDRVWSELDGILAAPPGA